MALVQGEARASPAAAAKPTRRGACTICTHPDREKIDAAIVSGAGGRPLAAQYGLTKQSIARHTANHIPTPEMAAGFAEQCATEGDRGTALVNSASELRDKALALLRKAEDAGDLKTALMGVREAARCLELVAKLTGQIDDSVQLNVTFAPVMLELQSVVITALAAYPEARMAVAQALGSIGGSSPRLLAHQS